MSAGGGPVRTESYHLLFVCTGNTCRSPLAEAVARREVERRGWTQLQVASAGVAAALQGPASEGAERAAERHGLDLAGHRSRPLGGELVDWADLILAMSPSHLRAVQRLGGAHKADLLGSFASGAEGEGEAVRDPFGGGEGEYLETLLQIERLVGAALDRLAAILDP